MHHLARIVHGSNGHGCTWLLKGGVTTCEIPQASAFSLKRGTMAPRHAVVHPNNYVVANKAGPTLVAMWQNPTASYSTCSPIMHQRAKCSRTTASEDDAPPAKSKHRIGYNLDWIATLSWHVPVYTEKGNPKSDVIGPQGSCL